MIDIIPFSWSVYSSARKQFPSPSPELNSEMDLIFGWRRQLKDSIPPSPLLSSFHSLSFWQLNHPSHDPDSIAADSQLTTLNGSSFSETTSSSPIGSSSYFRSHLLFFFSTLNERIPSNGILEYSIFSFFPFLLHFFPCHDFLHSSPAAIFGPNIVVIPRMIREKGRHEKRAGNESLSGPIKLRFPFSARAVIMIRSHLYSSAPPTAESHYYRAACRIMMPIADGHTGADDSHDDGLWSWLEGKDERIVRGEGKKLNVVKSQELNQRLAIKNTIEGPSLCPYSLLSWNRKSVSWSGSPPSWYTFSAIRRRLRPFIPYSSSSSLSIIPCCLLSLGFYSKDWKLRQGIHYFIYSILLLSFSSRFSHHLDPWILDWSTCDHNHAWNVNRNCEPNWQDDDEGEKNIMERSDHDYSWVGWWLLFALLPLSLSSCWTMKWHHISHQSPESNHECSLTSWRFYFWPYTGLSGFLFFSIRSPDDQD